VKTKDLIRLRLKADVPVLVWGVPGTGKTATFEAIAKEDGLHMEALIASTSDPVDVGGYLVPHAGEIVSDPPPWAKRIRAALDAGQRAMLFLDELSCAPPSVQAAFLRVVNERRVGNLDLRGMLVAGAANPADSATAEGDVGLAMANRWSHVDYQVDLSDWTVGTLSNWGQEASLAYSTVAATVTGFISKNPQALCKPGGRAWPSPRSWTNGIKSLAASGVDLKSADAQQVLAGDVGDAAASEWSSLQVLNDLPDPEDVLAGRAKVPTRGDRASATMQAVVAAALSSHSEKNNRIHKAWRLLSGQRSDLIVAPARALLTAGDDIPQEAVEIGNQIRRIS
jgi:hypothetical protein